MTETHDDQIHAHEVLAFIDAHAGHFDTSTLPDAVRAQFGLHASFVACNARGMTPELLMEFLLRREKIHLCGTGFRLNRANICAH